MKQIAEIDFKKILNCNEISNFSVNMSFLSLSTVTTKCFTLCCPHLSYIRPLYSIYRKYQGNLQILYQKIAAEIFCRFLDRSRFDLWWNFCRPTWSLACEKNMFYMHAITKFQKRTSYWKSKQFSEHVSFLW